MQNQNTATQLMDIAARIREMREILGFSLQKMAEMTEISPDTYALYESGTIDLPFTFMHNCAKAFGVEIPVLLEGHSAKLSAHTCVASQGPAIGLKFHDISWLMSGAVKPNMLPDMLAVHPRAPKYDFAVTSPGFLNVRMKSISGSVHSCRLVAHEGQ